LLELVDPRAIAEFAVGHLDARLDDARSSSPGTAGRSSDLGRHELAQLRLAQRAQPWHGSTFRGNAIVQTIPAF
jgi:hypothetical protein